MSKEIIFYPKSKLVSEVIPAPQTLTIPGWYKEISMYQNREDRDTNKLDVKNGSANYSIKSCMPFLDSMLSGYSLNLWCDIQVKIENGNTHINWINQDESLSPIESSPNPQVPSYAGFSPYIFSWISHWGVKTPDGYSCLFTHPLNRSDLPFHTSSGVIDSDEWGIWGTQPFSLREGWEGIIEAGTPIAQIIPFKRESWKSKVDNSTGENSLSEWANYEYKRHSSKFRGFYKNKYWNKKHYS
jgi:hypothetical protein